MVEWKKMWEMTTWDKKFNGVDRLKQPNVIKYHYYLANELQDIESTDGTIRILYTTEKVAFVNETDVEGNIAEGEVVAIPWGGNLSIKYFKGRFVTADNRIATSNDTSVLSNKFLYYWMLSQSEVISSFYRGAGIKHPSMQSVLNFEIPVPSLSEQERIVGILDTFTASIDNLKEQITQRRKQYEFYRDQLLDLEGKEEVEMKTLGEVCDIERGVRVVKKDLSECGTIPVFQNSLIPLGFYDKSNRKGHTPFVIIGGAAGEIGYSNIPFWAADDCLSLCNTNILLGKYLYHCLLINQQRIKSQVRKAGVPRLSRNVIENLNVPVPSLLEQERIVGILDTFEASITNLEAQLKEREKQYEYYRNKLLTFL